jgi:hypothetical protein
MEDADKRKYTLTFEGHPFDDNHQLRCLIEAEHMYILLEEVLETLGNARNEGFENLEQAHGLVERLIEKIANNIWEQDCYGRVCRD